MVKVKVLMGYSLFVLSLLFIGVAHLGSLAEFAQLYYFDLLRNLYIQLLVCALFTLAALMFFNKKIATIGFGILFIVIVFLNKSQQMTPPEKPNHTLQVVQANIRYYNPTIKDVYRSLKNMNADIYVLFEVNDTTRNEFIDLRDTYFDYGSLEIEGFPDGIGIISKYPIIKRTQHQIKLGNKRAVIIELDLLVGTEVLTIIALHPPSPRSLTDWHNRNNVLARLQKLIEVEEHQTMTLVVADLNTTPWSYYFPNNPHFNSCYEQLGHYVTWLPIDYTPLYSWLVGLPIDHCLFSEGLRISELQTHVVKGSDHLSISYTVSMLP